MVGLARPSVPGTDLAVKTCPRPVVSEAFRPTEELLNAWFGLSRHGGCLWLELLLILRLNQFCNEDPAAYLQLPFNFTIFIMRVLVVWKVSVETQAACCRVYKGIQRFSVSAVGVRFGSRGEKSGLSWSPGSGKNGFKVSKEFPDGPTTFQRIHSTLRVVFAHLEEPNELGSHLSWLPFENFSMWRRLHFVLFLKENIVRTLLRIGLIWWTAGSPSQTMKSKAPEIPPCFLPFFSSPFSPLLSPYSNHTLPFLRTGELAGCLLACWPQLALYHCKGMHEFSRRYVLSLSVLDTHYLLS